MHKSLRDAVTRTQITRRQAGKQIVLGGSAVALSGTVALSATPDPVLGLFEKYKHHEAEWIRWDEIRCDRGKSLLPEVRVPRITLAGNVEAWHEDIIRHYGEIVIASTSDHWKPKAEKCLERDLERFRKETERCHEIQRQCGYKQAEEEADRHLELMKKALKEMMATTPTTKEGALCMTNELVSILDCTGVDETYEFAGVKSLTEYLEAT